MADIKQLTMGMHPIERDLSWGAESQADSRREQEDVHAKKMLTKGTQVEITPLRSASGAGESDAPLFIPHPNYF